MRQCVVHGHRGARGHAPENTLAGFQSALNLGANSIEFDVNVSLDGKIVIYHDSRLNPAICRMPDGLRPQPPFDLIHQTSLKDLQDLDVGRLDKNTRYGRCFPGQEGCDGETIPTLEDLAELLTHLSANEILLNIEIKSNPLEPDSGPPPIELTALLLREVDNLDWLDRIWIQSFDWRVLQAVQTLCSDIPTGYLTSKKVNLTQATNIPATTSWLDEFNPSRFDGNITLAIAEAGGKYWGPDHLELTEPQVRKAQQYGLEVHPWTANTTEHIHRLCGWGVNGITSDYPDRAREIVNLYFG